MFQYRQALVRMRQGDSDRPVAAAHHGQAYSGWLRELGAHHHWLDVADCQRTLIAAALGQSKRASTTNRQSDAGASAFQGWAEQGVSGVAIYAALQREQG